MGKSSGWFISITVAVLTAFPLSCAREPARKGLPEISDESRDTFVQAGVEYRPAMEIPSGIYERTISVGQPGSILRLGILPGGVGEPVFIAIEGGVETEVAEKVSDSTSWFDIALPIRPGDYHIVLESRAPFYLSHCEAAQPASDKPNVLVFLVDTLRPDRMGCYGYERDTTPNVDAFAAQAIRFTRAVAQSSWTKPSAASILTSTYPGVHGAEDRPDVLRNGLPSLAATLRRDGYTTIGVVSNVNLQTRWGFGSDFDRYFDLTIMRDIDFNQRDEQVVRFAKNVLDETHGRPWMLYLHLMAPHGPYDPPSPFRERFPPDIADGMNRYAAMAEHIRSKYDGDIAFADSLFGQVLTSLEQRNVLDNTLIIFVSDHGEQFHEHGIAGHGHTLFDEELLVPLILKPPHFTNPPRVVEDVVEHVDIAPTILDLVGVNPNPRFQGTSILGLISGDDKKPRLTYAQLRLAQADLVAVRSANLKYVFDAGTGSQSFYDLVADPKEQAPSQEPLPGSGPLLEYAARRATADASGFHFLVTDSEGSNRNISGAINVSGMRAYNFRNPGGDIKAMRDVNTVSFDGRMKYPDDRHLSFKLWTAGVTLTNYVYLQVDVDADAEVRIEFFHDGDPPQIRAGQNATPIRLDGTPVRLANLIATPDRYAMPKLSPEFAVYAWYIPPVDSIEDEDLPQDVLDSLEALGYVR